jgi:hypothetical protein
MLACARLGVMHSVVFGGFTAKALRARIADAQAKLLITSDGQFRRGKPAPLKDAADEAVAPGPDGESSVEKVLVVRRTGIDVSWNDGRDVWWHDVVDSASPEHTAEPFDAEQPLFLLYTSGTTGKPKGIVHTSGGYLTQASYTHYYVFDIKPEHDVFWCTADIGWVTGHTYGVYGPLANGVTEVLYEGTPDSPDRNRHFQIIEKYGVTIYYTAPTLIRTFMKWGREIPRCPQAVQPAAAGIGRRTDQPRGVALVSRGVRRRQPSGCRHLVADRDRFGDDLAAAGNRCGQTGFGDDTAAGDLSQDRRRPWRSATARQRQCQERHRLPRLGPAVAIDAARHLG